MQREDVFSAHSRLISVWENRVDYNLTKSCVSVISARELVDDEAVLDQLLSLPLGYPQTDGTPELRERIANLYPGASADNVLVTTGAAQANYTAAMTLLNPGDEIVMLLPGYRQLWTVAEQVGFRVKPLLSSPEDGWRFDPQRIERGITDRTKMVVLCNPNNPTGQILNEQEREAVLGAARRVGAWILSDEVYSGTERLQGSETRSFWGSYERTLVTNSMSKTYGIPGVRIGWAAAPAEVKDAMWENQDHLTISASMLGNRLASFALSQGVRDRLVSRARRRVRDGYQNLKSWVDENREMFSLTPPAAGPIAFVRYRGNVKAAALVAKLVKEESTLVVPGQPFGADYHVRIGFDVPRAYLYEGLERLRRVVSAAN